MSTNIDKHFIINFSSKIGVLPTGKLFSYFPMRAYPKRGNLIWMEMKSIGMPIHGAPACMAYFQRRNIVAAYAQMAMKLNGFVDCHTHYEPRSSLFFLCAFAIIPEYCPYERKRLPSNFCRSADDFYSINFAIIQFE